MIQTELATENIRINLAGESIVQCKENVIDRTDVLVAKLLTTHAACTHKWASRNWSCRSDY